MRRMTPLCCLEGCDRALQPLQPPCLSNAWDAALPRTRGSGKRSHLDQTRNRQSHRDATNLPQRPHPPPVRQLRSPPAAPLIPTSMLLVPR
jgi:hypothetical protein